MRSNAKKSMEAAVTFVLSMLVCQLLALAIVAGYSAMFYQGHAFDIVQWEVLPTSMKVLVVSLCSFIPVGAAHWSYNRG